MTCFANCQLTAVEYERNVSIFTSDDKFEVATDEISLWEGALLLFCDEA